MISITISHPRIPVSVFSPLTIRHAMLEPLRYLFSKVPPEDLRYDPDPEKTKIVIEAKNTKFQDTVTQKKPRVIVDIGSYQFTRTGLSDNMTSKKPFFETGGCTDSQHMLMVQGVSQVIIQGEDEGVVLMMADMASNFITWSSPHICSTFGFKVFGLPLTVSGCEMDQEDQERFMVTLQIPWMRETRWSVKEDALELKKFFLTLVTE